VAHPNQIDLEPAQTRVEHAAPPATTHAGSSADEDHTNEDHTDEDYNDEDDNDVAGPDKPMTGGP